MGVLTREPSQAERSDAIDQTSIAPVPVSGRDSTAMHQFWIWAGANIAPINWILGALGIVLGLGLWETIAVLVVGNIVGCAILGWFTVIAHRTGVTNMVLCRTAFGRRGAYIPTLLQALVPIGFMAANTWVVLGIAETLLHKLGVASGDGTKVAIAVVIVCAQVGLATLGFYAIRSFEKWTVPVTIVILVAMTIIAWTSSKINWSYAPKVSGSSQIAMLSEYMTAIGIGWGLSWLTFSGDYSRFTRPDVSDRAVFWAGTLGNLLPTIWLGVLGATIATTGTGADPSTMIVEIFGAMSFPILLVVIHGPIAANIIDVYSASVAILALDVKVKRVVLALGIGIVGLALSVWLALQNNFAATFDDWMSSLVWWMTPWGAVLAVEYVIVRRRQVDVADLYGERADAVLGAFRWPGIVAFFVGLAAGWTCLYGSVPALQGPIARALNGVDLSWIAGGLVAAGTYYGLQRVAGRAGSRVASAGGRASLTTSNPVADSLLSSEES